MPQPSRRSFLAQVGGGLAVTTLSRPLFAAGANERVNVALVGCGVRGWSFVNQVSHMCDPDQGRLEKYRAAVDLPAENVCADLRRVLDNSDVDAIVIATPDHWHAPAAILACQAGKHVYVEKPVSHNFRESQLLQAAAKQSGVVVQHGTQQRSREFTRHAIQQLHEGIIGDVYVAKAWNIQHRGSIGRKKPSKAPANVDYDLWVGPAEYVPFQANRFHKDWHWWYNFGTGDIGNDGAHELDYARWGLGVETLPTRVSAVGGKYFYDDDQQFPDTATCTFEYTNLPGKIAKKQLIFEMRLWSTNYPMNCDSGVEFYGSEGQMFLSKRGKLRVIDGANKVILEERAEKEEGFPHFENFLAAIRSGEPLHADLTKAHQTVGLIHLANISLRVGRSLEFDPSAETVVNDAEAQRLLGRTYRQPSHWATPKINLGNS